MTLLAVAVAVPTWLVVMASLSIAIGVVVAAVVAWDVWRNPPAMWIMRLVWPLTMLYGGLAGAWFYVRFGRPASPSQESRTAHRVSVATGTSHCGAGCSLGDLIAEFVVAAVPALAVAVGWGSVYHERMFASWIWDFVLAYLLGIAFQYFTIAPMRGGRVRDNLLAAVKADTASILAWQVGMYATMALLQFSVFPALFGSALEVASPVFWFGMQWAMLAGFASAYPVNNLLIRKGVKEAM